MKPGLVVKPSPVGKPGPVDRRGFLGRVAGLLGMVAVGGVAVAPRGLAGFASGLSSAHGIAPGAGPAFDALGVQLYTVRSLMSRSVPETLAAVAEIGYREVELAGLFGHSPAAFRRILDENGLHAPSTHLGLTELEGDRLEANLEAAGILGHEWLIVPSLGRDQLTPEGIRRVAETLDRAGERAREVGVGVGFHNHAAEFEPWAEGSAMEVGSPMEGLLRWTDPELVRFQLDLFWCVDAGHDPGEWLDRHRGRWISVHVKDRTADGRMVPVGEGAIDFFEILPAAERAGVRFAFVEHDRPDAPHAAIAASFAHLRPLLGDR